MAGTAPAQPASIPQSAEYSGLRTPSPQESAGAHAAQPQGWLGRTWKSIVSWMGSKSDQLCDENGIHDPASRTAVSQALNAADLALPEHFHARSDARSGKINENRMISEAAIATILGDLPNDDDGVDSDRHEQREQWNNAIGDRIAAYAAGHHLGNHMDQLVLDAYRSGALITSLKDQRLNHATALQKAWNGPSPKFRAS
jgi:hypothetical protein